VAEEARRAGVAARLLGSPLELAPLFVACLERERAGKGAAGRGAEPAPE